MVDDIELARRKERLIARIAVQRTQLATTIHELEGPIAVADRLMAAVHFLRTHPVLAAVVVIGFIVFRRRRVVGLISSGVAAWRLWKSLGRWTGHVGAVRRRFARGS